MPTLKSRTKAIELDFSDPTCLQQMEAFNTPHVKAANPLEAKFTLCYYKKRLNKYMPELGGRDLTTLIGFWLREEDFRPRLKALPPGMKIEIMPPMASPDYGIYKLNYDELREICDQLTLLYPPVPLDCSRGTTINQFTGQEEHHLELTSDAFHKILTVLKGVNAHRDMMNLAMSCKHMYQIVKPCLDATQRIDRHKRPLRIESIWFEDLSWMVSSLNGFAFSNISTVSLSWDNRPRFTGNMRSPPPHRGKFAAAATFDTLAKKCDGLRTLDIEIAPNFLCTTTPVGLTRTPPTQSVYEVEGMKALKKLIQVVTGREGGGQVNISIASGDYDSWNFERGTPNSRVGAAEKQELLEWLKDGEAIEAEATFEGSLFGN